VLTKFYFCKLARYSLALQLSQTFQPKLNKIGVVPTIPIAMFYRVQVRWKSGCLIIAINVLYNQLITVLDEKRYLLNSLDFLSQS